MFQCRLPEEQAQALALISNRILNSNQSSSDNELMLGDQPADEFESSGNQIYSRRPRSKDIERLYEAAYERGDKRLLRRLDMFQRITDGLSANADQSINSQRLSELLLSSFHKTAMSEEHNENHNEPEYSEQEDEPIHRKYHRPSSSWFGSQPSGGKLRRPRRFAFSKGEQLKQWIEVQSLNLFKLTFDFRLIVMFYNLLLNF